MEEVAVIILTPSFDFLLKLSLTPSLLFIWSSDKSIISSNLHHTKLSFLMLCCCCLYTTISISFLYVMFKINAFSSCHCTDCHCKTISSSFHSLLSSPFSWAISPSNQPTDLWNKRSLYTNISTPALCHPVTFLCLIWNVTSLSNVCYILQVL